MEVIFDTLDQIFKNIFLKRALFNKAIQKLHLSKIDPGNGWKQPSLTANSSLSKIEAKTGIRQNYRCVSKFWFLRKWCFIWRNSRCCSETYGLSFTDFCHCQGVCESDSMCMKSISNCYIPFYNQDVGHENYTYGSRSGFAKAVRNE